MPTPETKPTARRKFQRVSDKIVDRTDHVWMATGAGWKCVLCGGVTGRQPPPYPTPTEWIPDDHEKLAQPERDLCPYDPQSR